MRVTRLAKTPAFKSSRQKTRKVWKSFATRPLTYWVMLSNSCILKWRWLSVLWLKRVFITISIASARLRQKTWKKSKRAWRNWLTKITMLSKKWHRVTRLSKYSKTVARLINYVLSKICRMKPKWVYTITKNMLICAVDHTCPIPVS